jgi:hypothetical protein
VDPPGLFPRLRGSQEVQKAWESEKYALPQQRFGEGSKLAWNVEDSQEYRMRERERKPTFLHSRFS